ncbi:M23 family metallopeptidase [Flavobacteriales bacterium]|nr:M23 family metallopeptidase [Flavobacteriales bacterium]
MNNKEKRTFWKKWRAKYRLVILNSENFEERLTFKASRISVFIFVFSSIIILVGGTSAVISFTPIREYIPGYTSADIRKKVVELNEMSDSLLIKLEQNQKYLANIKNIVADLPVEKPLKDSISTVDFKQDIVFEKNIEDSLLRAQVESEEKFNIFSNNKKESNEIYNVLFFKPIDGIVIEKFDQEKSHFGIDVVSKENELIKSTLDGVVMFSNWTAETGNVIAVMHKNDLVSIYKHNSTLLKKEGDKVDAGDAIAIIGNSGKWSSGPHLHFELWYKGEAINPEQYILF